MVIHRLGFSNLEVIKLKITFYICSYNAVFEYQDITKYLIIQFSLQFKNNFKRCHVLSFT